jgi:hypothetical protein
MRSRSLWDWLVQDNDTKAHLVVLPRLWFSIQWVETDVTHGGISVGVTSLLLLLVGSHGHGREVNAVVWWLGTGQRRRCSCCDAGHWGRQLGTSYVKHWAGSSGRRCR